ncbi:hypothetical protein BDBG_17324 [Blastomyces gilchristii SLH14081]|uniref:Uncharacterized protein n=1 Tax=Blastomyces gilchristii (strain SLH14081) TaxID=559298 RepID=A0A179UQ38_BLAGS|nr:uncharacterized protein BDBG_17324 [Blastomyces gilchristii SLH14081]OAT10195.1 hypothetical protein BDBG_17324 [Blastomyces gilchristii SLH14081]
MARDLQNKRDVALKVMSSGDGGENETRIQDEILQNGKDVSRLMTYFGPCLHPAILRNLSIITRRSAARQLLSEWKELYVGHWFLSTALAGRLNTKALGQPLKQIIPFVELWKQGELVHPIEIPMNLHTEKFYLGDIGLAMKLSDSVTQHGYSSMQLCSPD